MVTPKTARTLGPLAGGMVLAAILTMARPPAAVAECDGPAVSFRAHAPEAPVVVIGDVVSTDASTSGSDDRGGASTFTLDTVYVLRGDAADSIRVESVLSGPCSGLILARAGDRIALALGLSDKLFFGDKTWGAVAWIRGTPLEYSGVERVTVAEAFRVMGLVPPTTSTAPRASEAPSSAPLVLLVAGSSAAFIGIALRRRMAPVEP